MKKITKAYLLDFFKINFIPFFISLVVFLFPYRKLKFFTRSNKSIHWITIITRRTFSDFFHAFLPDYRLTDLPKNKRKILIFNWRDIKHSYAGGSEVFIHELASRWVKSGYHITMFCGNDGRQKKYEIIDGIQIIRRGGFYLVYFFAFFYYIFKFRNKFDLIIDCENGVPFFTPLYAKERKYLIIYHVHQEVFRTSLYPPFSWFAGFLELKVMPLAYRKTDVITISPSTFKEIAKLKLSDKRAKIVYSGVDLKRYKPVKNKSKIPLVLYLGRLKTYKSIDTLIHAASKVIESVPDTQFIIAGDGEERRRLKKLIKELGLESHIKLLRRVSEKSKIALYQLAWIFVNPSSMEGWGITTIEANACATPVIASDVPGLRDSVRDKKTGFLVKYRDSDHFAKKIVILLKNKRTREKMSINARRWAEKFDWDTSAMKFLEILK